jgi:succinate dehydrogenase/fumarate reductase flavoprotein subunit
MPGGSDQGLPLRLLATRPLDEAISSAGGVCFTALDEQLMLKDLPGVFCAGEMLDWEAPTGGYLLTACLASGHAAGRGCARLAEKVERETDKLRAKSVGSAMRTGSPRTPQCTKLFPAMTNSRHS